jgi:aspartate dehydrogenase
MGKRLKVGIVGCGAIGSSVARYIDRELKGKIRLVGIYDIDREKIESVLTTLKSKPKLLPISELIKEADLIVEAASIDAARDVIVKAYGKNKDLLILSVGVFVKYPQMWDLVSNYKGNIYIPSGAICGVDGLKSLAKGKIKRLTLTTSKPPRSLTGAPYLIKKNIDVFKLKRERIIFKGDIKQVISAFPQNINVAATIFLASQFKDVEVVIKVDPNLKRNTHQIEVEAQEGKVLVRVENVPSPENPKTSSLAILSTQALLEKITSHMKVGT